MILLRSHPPKERYRLNYNENGTMCLHSLNIYTTPNIDMAFQNKATSMWYFDDSVSFCMHMDKNTRGSHQNALLYFETSCQCLVLICLVSAGI